MRTTLLALALLALANADVLVVPLTQLTVTTAESAAPESVYAADISVGTPGVPIRAAVSTASDVDTVVSADGAPLAALRRAHAAAVAGLSKTEAAQTRLTMLRSYKDQLRVAEAHWTSKTGFYDWRQSNSSNVTASTAANVTVPVSAAGNTSATGAPMKETVKFPTSNGTAAATSNSSMVGVTNSSGAFRDPYTYNGTIGVGANNVSSTANTTTMTTYPNGTSSNPTTTPNKPTTNPTANQTTSNPTRDIAALHLCQNANGTLGNGTVAFGGAVSQQYRGSMHWVYAWKSPYGPQFPVSTISIGNTSVSASSAPVLDSMFSNIELGAIAFSAMLDEIRAVLSPKARAKLHTDREICFPSIHADLSILPDLVFHVPAPLNTSMPGSAFKLTVPPAAYLANMTDGCYRLRVAMSSSAPSDIVVLGQPFFNTYYTVIDKRAGHPMRLGFADIDCSDGSFFTDTTVLSAQNGGEDIDEDKRDGNDKEVDIAIAIAGGVAGCAVVAGLAAVVVHMRRARTSIPFTDISEGSASAPPKATMELEGTEHAV